MSAIAAPADRRFRRHHVKPARRRRQWRAWVRPVLQYSAIAALLAFGLYRGGAVAAHAHVLQIDRIAVSGNVRLSKGEVLNMLGSLRGESLLFTDLDAWRKRLQASPWVREAALRRSLPSTVDVVIVERQPMGIGRINGEMYLVDEHGVIIDQYGPQYADLDLPIVDGLTMSDGGSLTDEARAEFAARVIASLRPKPQIARRLSQIDVADLRNALVILSGDAAVVQLGDDQFLPRLQSYLDLAPTLRQRIPDIDYVDMRFDERVYVRPAGKPVRAIEQKR
ncbi:MAG: FtsQ-type POTRA domain-containing protein [Acidobacteriia bacterium]|nr:FtsQ-type POTRA domain-containing protein [Terriglobia bacterium]